MNKSAQPDEDVDWSQATPGVDYLCFDLYTLYKNAESEKNLHYRNFSSHSEARLDLSGGQFKLNFNLDGELA